jgi:hypothetical protein
MHFEPPGFGTCDGVPCFLGIVPGKTKLTESVKIASRWGKVFKGDEASHFTVEIDGKEVKVSAYYSEEYVDVVWTSLDPPVPIDVILERHGPPCGISIYKTDPDRTDTLNGAQILVFYRGVRFDIYLRQWQSDHFAPIMFVHRMTLEDPQAQNSSIPCTIGRYGDPHTIGSPWLGFTSYRRYQQFKIKADTPK